MVTGTNGDGHYDEVGSDGFEADQFKIDFEVWDRSREVTVWGFLQPQEMWKFSLTSGALDNRMFHVAPGDRSHKSARMENVGRNYISHSG